jgi:glucokinase
VPRGVIAVDLGGTKVAVAFVEPRGRIRARSEEPVDTADPIEQIARMSRKIGAADAIGVAVPGLARRDGTVWAPNLPGWDRVPLARELKKRLRIPAFVESDRNAAALGEAWRGVAKGKADVIVLIVGTGIGAGILSGGQLIRGAHELSGCAGWMVVTDETNDATSTSGALEALAAGPAIARASDAPTAAEAADRARRGDPKARVVFDRAAQRLGLAIANLVSLFDPEIVVLTGGLSNANDLLMEGIRTAAASRAQPLSFPHVEIVTSTLGTEANLLGAARLAMDHKKI